MPDETHTVRHLPRFGLPKCTEPGSEANTGDAQFMDQLFIIRPGNGVYAMLGVALGDTSLTVERRDTYPGYVRFGVSALKDMLRLFSCTLSV